MNVITIEEYPSLAKLGIASTEDFASKLKNIAGMLKPEDLTNGLISDLSKFIFIQPRSRKSESDYYILYISSYDQLAITSY